uniref:DUF1736 domain-containing protein n=1 Tax=Chrysotila carterae TaxID=13221 RepID=A0A7S4BM56_CHRCT
MKLWLLPSAVGVLLFCTPKRVYGPFLYDDKAAVQGNPIVIGNHSLTEALRLAFSKDFWGKDDLTDEKSHKSFRPIVTLSYYANFELHGLSTWGYHLVNAVVHGINTALAYGLVRAAYGWDPQSTRDAWVAAMLFAVHPVHCEAVQNMVGRAEVFMAFFYMLGFIAYAHLLLGRGPLAPPTSLTPRAALGVVIMLFCSLCAMLCKETGVTLPLFCIVWDALVVMRLQLHQLARLNLTLALPSLHDATNANDTHDTSAKDATNANDANDANDDHDSRRLPFDGRAWRAARAAAARYAASLLVCVAMALWRASLNGDTEASINVKQNAPGFYPHPLWRSISIAWVWVEYCWTCVVPFNLCCDWSAPALPPIESWDDARLLPLSLCAVAAARALYSVALVRTHTRTLMGIATAFMPFLLASNLLFPVGTCKAERVLYLPVLGVCMLLAQALSPAGNASRAPPRRLGLAVAFGAVVAAYAGQCWWYADVWTDGAALWENAVAVQDGRPSFLRGRSTVAQTGIFIYAHAVYAGPPM